MKTSIRSQFITGMLFLVIILVLALYSSYRMNQVSIESGNILKENYLSLGYARDMDDGLTLLHQELIRINIFGSKKDSLNVHPKTSQIRKWLEAEKNNITEPGEGLLVATIEKDFKEYTDSLTNNNSASFSTVKLLYLQNKFEQLHQQLMKLSRMNGNAIEQKTDRNKLSTQEAIIQLSIIATLCFMIALYYAFSFSKFSGENFTQFYDGIMGFAEGDYRHQLVFNHDERLNEISIVFNEMASKLAGYEDQIHRNEGVEPNKIQFTDRIEELKLVATHLRTIETKVDHVIKDLSSLG